MFLALIAYSRNAEYEDVHICEMDVVNIKPSMEAERGAEGMDIDHISLLYK